MPGKAQPCMVGAGLAPALVANPQFLLKRNNLTCLSMCSATCYNGTGKHYKG